MAPHHGHPAAASVLHHHHAQPYQHYATSQYYVPTNPAVGGPSIVTSNSTAAYHHQTAPTAYGANQSPYNYNYGLSESTFASPLPAVGSNPNEMATDDIKSEYISNIKSEYVPTPYVTPSPTLDLNSSAEVDVHSTPSSMKKITQMPAQNVMHNLMETANNSASLRSISGVASNSYEHANNATMVEGNKRSK